MEGTVGNVVVPMSLSSPLVNENQQSVQSGVAADCFPLGQFIF